MRLEGKVALISGGARGMGATEARLFASEGARVILGDILEEHGQQVQAEVAESGGEAVFVRLDVTVESDWRRAVDTAVQRFGKLDILVNNAGIFDRSTVQSQTIESWDRVMGINAKGVFLGTKAAIPAMRDAGGGSIVNISSVRRTHRQHSSHFVQHLEGCGADSHKVHRDTVCRRRHPLQFGPPPAQSKRRCSMRSS